MSDYGPIELLVFSFPEAKLNGAIAPELAALSDAGLIRILDLVFLIKDADGNIEGFELSDMDPELQAAFDILTDGATRLVRDEDVEDIGDALDPGSAAGILVVEHLWSTRLASAIAESGGELSFSTRIPHEAVDAVLALEA